METLELDAAIDNRAPDVAAQLPITATDGIDIHYDNIAGPIAADVLPLMNKGGRYLVCGTIAANRNLALPNGPDNLQSMLATVLVKQLRVQGFLFDNFVEMIPEFRRDMSNWMTSGQVKYQEDIVEGLENAAEAFLGLFNGRKKGKILIAV